MKKTIILTIIIAFLGSSILLFSKKDREDLYMSALMEKDQLKKFQKLEEYFTKYTKSGKKKKYVTAPLYIQLVNTSLTAKQYDKTQFYAEKALECDKLTAIDKLDVKIGLIKYYAFIKKDTEAMDKIINEVKSYEKRDSLPNFNSRYLSQIKKIQIALSASETTTPEATKESMLKAFKLFDAKPTDQNAKIIYFFAKKLYDEFDSADAAILGLEKICSSKDADIKYIDILADWYKYDNIYEKASIYLIRSYNMKPSSLKAYEIGKVMTEINIDKAISYYAESFVRNTNQEIADKSKELLTKLFKDEKGEGLTEEELTTEIEKIIEEAKNRLKEQN